MLLLLARQRVGDSAGEYSHYTRRLYGQCSVECFHLHGADLAFTGVVEERKWGEITGNGDG